MLEELHKEGANFGLTINMSKTKFMKNEFADENSVRVQGDPLEEVTEYVYLGRLLNMKNDLKPEILRRKKAGWAAFNSVRGVIGSVKDHALRANIFNSTVLPALCYSCETWTLTKKTEDQLRRIQAALERKMAVVQRAQMAEQLIGMGFTAEQVFLGLLTTQGDRVKALDMLLGTR
ncbi:hypothetical protein Q1695_008048 [Nippostrongylus brasiliensis]|nr:hypothetical protein Q1695_008048 [Nippostrongylus brasiliensis]